MTDRVCNVLFLCTGNSARSTLGEALLNKDGEGRFHAVSAGSQPKSDVHPLTIRDLDAPGYCTEDLTSKSWDTFSATSAPQMDFIFTVCDNAAGKACPLWIGHPMTAHWGIEDPTAAEGNEPEIQRAFAQTARFLKNRTSAFLNLTHPTTARMALQNHLKEIDTMEGGTQTNAEKN